MVQLGLDLLNHGRDLVSAHGRINVHESTVLHNRRGAVEGGSSLGGRLLLALSSLLDGRQVVIVELLLADNLGALDARVVDLAVGLGLEAAAGLQGGLFLADKRGVKEMEQAVGTANLVEVGGVAGFGEHLLGALLLALLLLALTLSLVALPGLLLLLALPVVKCFAGSVVVVLALLELVPLLTLLGLQFGALVTEAAKLLVGGVLLGLDGVEFGLDRVVLLGERLGLGVVGLALGLLDLGIQLVNSLLLLLDQGELLSRAAQFANLLDRLLLVQQCQLARGNLSVELLDPVVKSSLVPEADGLLQRLQLLLALLDLLVQALDLLLRGSARVLAIALLLADFVELGNEFLAALLGGVLGVLAGSSELNLCLDGVLCITTL